MGVCEHKAGYFKWKLSTKRCWNCLTKHCRKAICSLVQDDTYRRSIRKTQLRVACLRVRVNVVEEDDAVLAGVDKVARVGSFELGEGRGSHERVTTGDRETTICNILCVTCVVFAVLQIVFFSSKNYLQHPLCKMYCVYNVFCFLAQNCICNTLTAPPCG